MRFRKYFGAGALSMGLLIFTTTATFAQTPNSNKISPNHLSCTAEWEFNNVTEQQSGTFHNIVTGTSDWNQTQGNVAFTSKILSSSTYSASVNASLGGGWGPINASVGVNADTSQTWTTSESTTLNIPPGYKEWNDYGTDQDVWYGDYEYLNNLCDYSNQQWITVKSPRTHTIVNKSEYKGF